MTLGKNMKHDPSIINTPSYVKFHNTDILLSFFNENIFTRVILHTFIEKPELS